MSVIASPVSSLTAPILIIIAVWYASTIGLIVSTHAFAMMTTFAAWIISLVGLNVGAAYGSYSSTTYNYAAAQATRNTAQANSEARFARLESEGRENLQNLSSTILKKETIFPGAWPGGIVKVELPEVVEQPQDIRLVVTVVGERHEFKFTQEKVESK